MIQSLNGLSNAHLYVLSTEANMSLRPTKRLQQLPPTPSTPGHSLAQASRPGYSQAVHPVLPQPSRQSRKRTFPDVDPASNLVPKRSRLEGWLKEVSESPSNPTRASSCPPRLEISNLSKTIDIGQGQQLSFDEFQEMSQSQRQNFGPDSVESARSSRPSTSHIDYRKTLHNNGIYIDNIGDKIPLELRTFLDTHILKERPSKLSSQAIAEAVDTADRMADSPEGNVYSLIDTVMLPIKRLDVGRGGNTPWYTDGLPRNKIYPVPLASPKANIHFGYPTDHTSHWKVEENAVIDHGAARRLTQPAKGNCFPFFVFELKSEAMGGNHWQAENQAAGSGASCVNSTRWLFLEAYPLKAQSVVDTIAFSACVTHRLVIFHVHFYLAEKNRNYMSWIATCETMRQVQKSNHLVESIFEHSLGVRQTKIREAIALLYPFPDHWKDSRPASVMDAQNPSANDEVDASNKSQRTE